MDNSTEDSLAELDAWILQLTQQDLSRALRDLELNETGTAFVRLNRLRNRLIGNYSASDFVQNSFGDESQLIRHRDSIRQEYIDRTFGDPDPQVQTRSPSEDLNAPRRYAGVNQNPGANSTLRSNRGASLIDLLEEELPARVNATVLQVDTSRIRSTGSRGIFEGPAERVNELRTASNTHSQPIQNAADPQQLINTRIFEALGEITQTLREIRLERTAGTHNASNEAPRLANTYLLDSRTEERRPLTSTHLHDLTRRLSNQNERARLRPRVNFDEDVEIIESSSTREDPIFRGYPSYPQGLAQPPSHRDLRRTAYSGDTRGTQAYDCPGQQDTSWEIPIDNFRPPVPNPRDAPREQSSWGRGDAASLYGRLATDAYSDERLEQTTRLMNRPRDLGETIRRWKIQFSGVKGECIEEFLTRVEECRALADMTDSDLLRALPVLLAGVAIQWYRVEHEDWLSWNDFCAAARRTYGVDRTFQQRLEAEANARTQGAEEPVRNYIYCLRAILKRYDRRLPLEKEIDLLHKNMLPDLQLFVRREEIQDVQTLLQRAMEAERINESRRAYRPPPLPEQSLLPDVAYRAPTPAPMRSKLNVAAVEDLAAEEVAAVREQVTQLNRVLASWKQAKGKQTTGQAARPGMSTPITPGGRGAIPKQTPNASLPPRQGDGRGGHQVNRTQPPPNISPAFTGKCRNCDQLGHHRLDCPEPEFVRCYGCQTVGVRLPDCPKC